MGTPHPGVQIWHVERIEHPYAPLLVATTADGALACIVLGAHREKLERDAERADAEWVERPSGPPSNAVRQVLEYLHGDRREFDLELRPTGTRFERAAWEALCAIPFGETRTYGEQARALGRPTAARAVGAANGRNPIPIVIPCHRVVGADGSLTGFGGGLPMKAWLLAHEDPQGRLFNVSDEVSRTEPARTTTGAH
jgi:methylated-DNA-[protein]-cysteine S-methyltransferase